MALIVFIASLTVFLFLGVPIAIALGACAIVLMFYLDFFDPIMMAQRMVGGTNNFILMAIPFFILAGEIMARGGLAERIIEASNVLVGRIRGGLGYTNILSSIAFAGLSGSAVADVAMSGSILYPVMVKKGYKEDRAMGLICAGSIIAMIIPPSIPMIVLGTTVGLSITRLFMAGIFPGLVLGLALMIAWFFIARKDGLTDTVKFTFRESMKILWASIPALFMPVIIIGGIRFGIFTPTEAGAFAVVYALLICTFVYRGINFKILIDCLVGAARSTAMVMFIISAAMVVGWLITIAQVPDIAVQMFSPLIDNPLLLLLLINVFLFLVGMVMDLTPNILIFAPVLFPIIIAAGIEPHFFAVIMVLNLSISLLTPPVGNVLLMGCSVGKLSFGRMVMGILPFLAVEIVVLLIFMLFPALVLVPMNFLT
ncbi:MAG: TRAP transporter large permease subunit [Defluviitaleaceae bacterium]|nr:TRAP transporter large permease subunit [Defluviitaleaceae bacterium]